MNEGRRWLQNLYDTKGVKKFQVKNECRLLSLLVGAGLEGGGPLMQRARCCPPATAIRNALLRALKQPSCAHRGSARVT